LQHGRTRAWFFLLKCGSRTPASGCADKGKNSI